MPATKRAAKGYPSKKKVRRSRTKAQAGYTASGAMVAAAEIKFFDTVFPAAGIPAGPASLIDSTVVAEIVNGTGPSDRIGRRIKVVKVDYSYALQLVGASGNNDCARYDIWLDRQCNGIAPAPGALYTSAATLGTNQMPNLFNEKRFKRLYTKTHLFNTMNSIGAGGVGSNVGMKFEGSFRPNCVIEYDDTTGNITDLTSNNIFQCWSSDSGLCVIQSNFVRIHYVDA